MNIYIANTAINSPRNISVKFTFTKLYNKYVRRSIVVSCPN